MRRIAMLTAVFLAAYASVATADRLNLSRDTNTYPHNVIWTQLESFGLRAYRKTDSLGYDRPGATLTRAVLFHGNALGNSDPLSVDADELWAMWRDRPPHTDIVLSGTADSSAVWIFDARNGQLVKRKVGKKFVVDTLATFIKTTRNLHNVLNRDIAHTRAERLNEASGGRCYTSKEPIILPALGYRGVVVAYYRLEPGVPSLMPGRDTVYIPSRLDPWIRPSLSLHMLGGNDVSVVALGGAVSGGLKFDKYYVGLYGGVAQNFRAHNRGTSHAGVQFGHDLGWFFRTGVRGAWDAQNFSGFNRMRLEGWEIGIGRGGRPGSITLMTGFARHAVLEDQRGENDPFIGVEVNLGGCFVTNPLKGGR